jgi:hypothetical protein
MSWQTVTALQAYLKISQQELKTAVFLDGKGLINLKLHQNIKVSHSYYILL